MVERIKKPRETQFIMSGITSEFPLDYTTLFALKHDSAFSYSAETSSQNSDGVMVNRDGVFYFITPRKGIFMTNYTSISSIHENATTPIPGISKGKRTVSADLKTLFFSSVSSERFVK